MKTSFSFFPRALCLVLILVPPFYPIARAAVGFSVTPATVSNTYDGSIALQITGLSSGESVVVQEFLDVNTNGVIDVVDILWQQFRLTDGQASVIAGVTNINVPGDTDSVAGQITARLVFQGADPALNFVGKYAWKLSSPLGLFAPPITNLFTITDTDYAQSLTGNVLNNGTNVPNALVILFNAPQPGDDGPGWGWGATVANNVGSYAIKVPPGTYVPAAFKADFLGSLAAAPVTVPGGVTVSTNLTLLDATRTISGKLADAANPSIGLPGFFLHAEAGGLAGIGNSDSNGNFTIRVGPGLWDFGENGAEALGYLSLDSDVLIDTFTGNVSGLLITYPKATALFHGTVRDQQDQPVARVSVYADDDDDLFDSSAFTDSNGYYVAGALGGGSSPWSVDIDGDQPFATNYLFSPGLYGTNLSAGQSVLHNFTAIGATYRITGTLQDNLGQPISGVRIYAYANIGGVGYDAEGTTDAGGNYSIGVANGTWNVSVFSGGYDNGLSSDYLPPPSRTVGITNSDGVANFTATLAPYHITGWVKVAGTNPIPDAYVSAYATISGTNYSQSDRTDGAGNYSIGVLNGNWTVWICCDCGEWPPGFCCPDSQPVNIANANGVANFTAAGQITITTPSPLPEGYVDENYSLQFNATTCVPGTTWSTPNPPAGLYLDPDGELSGYPESCGSNYFVVEVRDGTGGTANKAFSLVINPSTNGSVWSYYVFKQKSYRQTTAAGPVLDSGHGPYNAYLGLAQYPLCSVSFASCTPPGSTLRLFPPGNSELELQVHESFATESAFDAAYPTGDYTFEIRAVDGNHYPVLSLPATSSPNAPRIVNYSAAQAINAGSDFSLQWDLFAGGTTNDFIRLFVFDTNEPPAFRLWSYPYAEFEDWPDGTATTSTIPGDTLQANHTYVGVLEFFRVVDTNENDYPNAYGQTLFGAQTAFTLTTASAAPILSQPARLSATQFRFLVTALAGQNYTIQKSGNLSSTNWSVLLVTNAPTSSFTVIDASATNSRAYYRALRGP